MIKGILYKYLLKALVIALLGLILFGVVPGLSTVLLLFIGFHPQCFCHAALVNHPF